MDKIALAINGSHIVADKGTTILEAALKNGIYIPHLCYHPDLKPPEPAEHWRNREWRL